MHLAPTGWRFVQEIVSYHIYLLQDFDNSGLLLYISKNMLIFYVTCINIMYIALQQVIRTILLQTSMARQIRSILIFEVGFAGISSSPKLKQQLLLLL